MEYAGKSGMNIPQQNNIQFNLACVCGKLDQDGPMTHFINFLEPRT